MNFTWDAAKAEVNARKHHVTFDEATTAFADPLATIYPDEAHADRFVLVGESEKRRLLYVVHLELGDDEIRLISARVATSHERKRHEEGP